ncbi:MAG TPA: SAM-dependent methyltransferase, partial [Chitinophagales bacterium]|nr:SAM-dependent methyltransferase [Chitinophagales bacterium]
MTEHLSKEYWEQRYADGTTGWDMGVVAPALKQYFDSIERKDAAILIPGCGNAWEAKYLVEQGFTNITVIDIAEPPVNHLRE